MKKIGHLKDAHGLKGEIIVHIPSEDISWIDDLIEFQLVNPTTLEAKTYQVEMARPHKNGLRIKAEGIVDRTQVESMRGWHFLIDKNLFISKPGETIFLSEILNFKVTQKNGEFLGEIVGFSSNGVQDLLQIKNEKGVFEAPFVEQLIVKIDFENKNLIVDFPEGLQE